MNNRLLFSLSAAGVALALASAWYYGRQPQAQPPAFSPASNPYADGIYANGIIESEQSSGANVNLYPEVAGTVAQILVTEGQTVTRGTPLLRIDASVQQATAEQLQAQAEAAQATLDALKAQPRRETLDVVQAQVDNATALLKSADDQLAKIEQSHRLEPLSVSADQLDNARNAQRVAASSLQVVQKQYALAKAGAWVYDLRNQQRQVEALGKAHAAAVALLDKYTLRAPADGVVLAVQTVAGSYVSAQGTYDSYTQGYSPVLVVGATQDHLAVRCYIDEILVHRLPAPEQIKGLMVIRGTDRRVPLSFVRMQPYVSPKIELTTQRKERVDVRVLPLIFRFDRPKDLTLYPGQMVDVYVGTH